MLDELRGPLESEVELLIGVRYWLIPVLRGVSASRCVGGEGFCAYCIKDSCSCSGSGITRGASRFGEGKRGG